MRRRSDGLRADDQGIHSKIKSGVIEAPKCPVRRSSDQYRARVLASTKQRARALVNNGVRAPRRSSTSTLKREFSLCPHDAFQSTNPRTDFSYLMGEVESWRKYRTNFHQLAPTSMSLIKLKLFDVRNQF